ncbi:MAG: Ku protein [Parachlamydia sp.]|jgi:DNA end-binding protein Ku|nr:Ku protein [Parachlamydia sp.]
MPRAIWTGSLSFGLINIPVRVYSATQEKALSFDMLHKKDLSPIRLARICKADGKEIPYEDIVKGYEYQKGDYIVLTDEDFKQASVKKTKTIDIQDFIEESEVDSVYFVKPYFLEPDKGADKAYALLREALKKSKKVGLAKFVLHNREHIAVIKPIGNVLVLNQLRYLEELRQPVDLNLPKKETANAKEISVALKLIDQLTAHFDPVQYHDTYVEDLKGIINDKLKGKKPAKVKGKTVKITGAKDIMTLLKESLETHHKKSA